MAGTADDWGFVFMSKKDKHARTQAKYMARKREDGLEWLAVWVPEPAFEAFKTIAKAARKSRGAPAPASLAEAAALAERQGLEVPDWAQSSDALLMVWQASLASGHVLQQLQGERDAERARKAEAKAAKPAAEATDGDDANPPSADLVTEEPAAGEPIAEAPDAEEPKPKRGRRAKAASPEPIAEQAAAPAPTADVHPAEAVEVRD
jgi:hypothetical protein